MHNHHNSQLQLEAGILCFIFTLLNIFVQFDQRSAIDLLSQLDCVKLSHKNMLLQTLTSLALAGTALCAPATNALRRRDEVDHDSLNPIATRVQDGPLGAAIEKFNPRLHIASGCQPYTAVDDSGNTKQVATPSIPHMVRILTNCDAVVV